MKLVKLTNRAGWMAPTYIGPGGNRVTDESAALPIRDDLAERFKHPDITEVYDVELIATDLPPAQPAE
jgi:hypothetical protein